LLFVFAGFSLHAAELVDDRNDKNTTGKIVPSKLFDKQMVFVDGLYVQNDVLEFSVFDISEVEIVDDSGSAKIQYTSVDGSEKTQVANLSGEDEIRRVLPEIPKFYYTSLKKEILRREVPVTLYAKDPPDYAKPIKLAVKLKKIHLKPLKVSDDGNYIQPVEMKIYGQIKDKKSDQILTRFYDSDSAEFVLGSGSDELQKILGELSHGMMTDFVLYLKSRY